MTWRLLAAIGLLTIICVMVFRFADPRGSKSRAEPSAPADAPEGLTRLSKTGEVWIDKKRNAVIADGQVCLREGQLEMFACPKGTKEHEAVVSLNCKAEEI